VTTRTATSTGTTVPSPAAELRAAAARIRWRTKGVPAAHWFAAGREDDDTVLWIWTEDEENPKSVLMIQTDDGDAEQEAALAEHIATWSPPPALAVAAWLEQTAERHAPHQLPTAPDGYAICWTCDKGPDNHTRAPCPDLAAALDAARAISGGETP
jgi:hypothetical protein